METPSMHHRTSWTLMLGAGVLALAAPAMAQTSGTTTVTGSTPEAFSITSGSDGALSSTVALGSLTPGNATTASGLTAATMDVRLRSNKGYKLTATAGTLSVSGAGTAAGGGAVTLSDIGFGVVSVTSSGANVATGRTDTILTGYDVSGGWPAATNGVTPAFSKTMTDITGGVEVLSGSRISARGNLATDNNFITVRFGVAALPQFYTPNNGFSSVVTLTIAAQ